MRFKPLPKLNWKLSKFSKLSIFSHSSVVGAFLISLDSLTMSSLTEVMKLFTSNISSSTVTSLLYFCIRYYIFARKDIRSLSLQLSYCLWLQLSVEDGISSPWDAIPYNLSLLNNLIRFSFSFSLTYEKFSFLL